jgi:hypothetical protein
LARPSGSSRRTNPGDRLLDPAEYIAVCRAIGVDPYELLQKAEKEVGS